MFIQNKETPSNIMQNELLPWEFGPADIVETAIAIK